MEEELELQDLKEREGTKVKRIELIKPPSSKPDIRWLVKLETERGKNIIRIRPYDCVVISGNFKADGLLTPDYLGLEFREVVPALFIRGRLHLGDEAVKDVIYHPTYFGFSSSEEAERFLKEKKLLEAI